MAKLTDARVTTLQNHFNIGDQPTEGNFADLVQWIQEGIEEHDHDGTGNGDGILFSTLGVGLARTEGTLHIRTASAGAVTADVSANDLVVENSNDGGISILVPDANQANIFFGSPSDDIGAMIRWEYSHLRMILGTTIANGILSLRSGDAAEVMRLDANQNVCIGGGAAEVSAILELKSTTGALLLTRMTTAQRDALTAVNGMVIYNTSNNRIEAYENGSWVDI